MKYKSLIAATFAALFLYVAVFAQSAMTGTVIKNANLRAGPGTTYAIVGTVKAGQTVTITEKNAAGTWYHLDNSKWIATFLVKLAATPDVTPQSSNTAQPPATTPTTAAPTTTAPAATAVPPTSVPPTPVPPAPVVQRNCDPSYPDVCIPRYPPDLDCPEISFKRFRVIGSDPHGFDGDNDGIGCER